LNKLQRVEQIETYEPKQLSLEISQSIDMIRDEFKEKQAETEEDLSPFTIIEDKGFERFKELFGSNPDEEEDYQLNYRRFENSAFDVRTCKNHRNAVELFSYKRKYVVVTKSFSHLIGNTRLTMTIWKLDPTDETPASFEKLWKVEWPIVD